VFTGIVEEIGRVRDAAPRDGLLRLSIAARTARQGLRPGDSVSVNGCCQTVAALDDEGFLVEAMPQTLGCTTLGALHAGDAVHLERALRAGDPLGGHLVLGHVDGVGEVESVTIDGGDHRVTVRVPEELARYLAPRGSIAVDGVSLTIAAADGARATVALVPTTLERTTARAWRAGTRVNVEVDLLARYLERLLSADAAAPHEAMREPWLARESENAS
jgi:riboflavin synthase